MNEGARIANESIHRRTVESTLDAILKELKMINELMETLAKAKPNNPDNGKDIGEEQ